MPTVTEMLEAALKPMGADGLYNPDSECGCLIGDLMPCDSYCGRCVAAWNNPSRAKAENTGLWMIPFKG
jgi:hypothetical protein